MIDHDCLRPPLAFDPTAGRYKDWLHLNLLHHPSGAVGLVNLSLHGPPGDPRSLAIGSGVVHVPDIGWVGQTQVHSLDQAALGDCSIALREIALAVDEASGLVLANAVLPDDSLEIRLTAKPNSQRIVIEEHLALGHGWISWYAVPRLTLSGQMTACGRHFDLSAASAYHDHNWGRWFWGDDFGWEWGCFLAPAPGPAFVMSRTTDRGHRRCGEPSLAVFVGNGRRDFPSARVSLQHEFSLEAVTRRLPGAMAALHQDRARSRVPKTIHIAAEDGRERVEIEFSGRSALQVVAADPIATGYGFIHEIAGDFRYLCRLAGEELTGSGLAMVEYVD